MHDETKPLKWGLPALAVVAYFLSRADGFLMNFLFWHFQMGFHELGHAIAGWMTGQAAIPTYGFTILFGESVFFHVLFLAALGGGAYYGQVEESAFLKWVCTGLFLISLAVWAIARGPQIIMLFNLGGFLGEILISTIFICSFYYQLPRRFHWGFFRYFFVFISFIVLFKSYNTWSRAYQSPGNLPMSGSIHSSTDKSDTEKLLESRMWTGHTLPNFLVKTQQLCFFVIIVHYIIGFISTTPTPSRRRHDENA